MKKLLFGLVFLLGACSDTTIEPDLSRVGYDYFPLVVGQYVIYNVEAIDYDILGNVDSSYYELKVEVVDSFRNQAGAFSYILHRSTRENDEQPWQFSSAWSSYKTSNIAVLIEENVPYLKLTFPIENKRQWDGNSLNTNEVDEYEYDGTDQLYVTPDNDSIQQVLRVVQNDNQDTIIQQDKRIEMYAKNIGLVYKEALRYDYCAETSCIGLQQIESGHYYKQELVSYGKN